MAFLFPGQGSQSVGMLKQVHALHSAVGETFSEASDLLGYDLWALVSEGPEKDLNLTEFTQPAILTSSVALFRCLTRHDYSLPNFLAGHSLGEYSALVVAGCIDFSDAVMLVQARGRAMQTAVPEGEGAMAAVIGLEDSIIDDVCASFCVDSEFVGAVNYNSPGQVVIAGHTSAVGKASSALSRAGARRLLPLPVSAPFHTPLMQPAAQVISDCLASIRVIDAKIPIVSNVDSQPHVSSEKLTELLVKQTCEPVIWTDCMRTLLNAGCNKFVECGPGRVLSGLMRRIDKAAECFGVDKPESLMQLLKKKQD